MTGRTTGLKAAAAIGVLAVGLAACGGGSVQESSGHHYAGMPDPLRTSTIASSASPDHWRPPYYGS